MSASLPVRGFPRALRGLVLATFGPASPLEKPAESSSFELSSNPAIHKQASRRMMYVLDAPRKRANENELGALDEPLPNCVDHRNATS
jgi:hypothetical protein